MVMILFKVVGLFSRHSAWLDMRLEVPRYHRWRRVGYIVETDFSAVIAVSIGTISSGP
jgi:hypothetical protein